VKATTTSAVKATTASTVKAASTSAPGAASTPATLRHQGDRTAHKEDRYSEGDI
jgi:hypothetical protein